MVSHKNITKIIAAITAVAVALCLLAVVFSDKITEAAGGGGTVMEYETALFDTSEIMTVNIIMDEDDWSDMLENAIDEEYRSCDVEINGTTFYNVAIRPKGNTSLSSIASDPTTDRYSFKLEFDYYVEGQTCFGLDKLVLNNNYADATGMKEALVYDMFAYLGADASLYNYAKISVNGEYWGVYLALEAVEDSFMLRNYGAESGELYKPEGMNMGGGNMGGGNTDAGSMTPPDSSATDSSATVDSATDSSSDGADAGGESPSRGGGFGGEGGFSSGSGGADLNYTDDELSSYDTIWDGEITSTSKADHKRVVTALKNISEGNDLETYMDVDNLLRYAAVHIFSVNDDSLSGSMAHNYYLYEHDGALNLIPWDYNLAFGGMGGGSATDVVNSAIDDAFSLTEFFDTLMADEDYHSRYYAYLAQLVDEYINGGGFDAFYERVRSQIDSLVETDPTAFYTYEEYETAAETLYELVKLRGESVSGQINGTIPSTESEQRSSDALIDASSLNLSALGSMNGGGGGSDMGGGQRPDNAGGPDGDFDPSNTGGFDPAQSNTTPSTADSGTDEGTADGTDSNEADGTGTAPSGFDPAQGNSAPDILPDGFDPSQMKGGFDGQRPDNAGGMTNVGTEGTTASSTDTENTTDGVSDDPQQTTDGGSTGGVTDGNATADGSQQTGGRPNADDSQQQAGGGQRPDNAGGPGGDFGPSNTGGSSSQSDTLKNLAILVGSLAVLAAALVFAVRYRRRPRRR